MKHLVHQILSTSSQLFIQGHQGRLISFTNNGVSAPFPFIYNQGSVENDSAVKESLVVELSIFHFTSLGRVAICGLFGGGHGDFHRLI